MSLPARVEVAIDLGRGTPQGENRFYPRRGNGDAPDGARADPLAGAGNANAARRADVTLPECSVRYTGAAEEGEAGGGRIALGNRDDG